MSRQPLSILRSDTLAFPPPDRAGVDGLLAIGGDLSVDRLLLAYRSGIFPWTDDPITWWSPNPRAIFDLETFRPSHRLSDKLKRNPFTITFDQAFDEVIKNCARPAPGRETTWISPEFISAYIKLHELGYAHSVEAWQNKELVGGVYGVAIGGFFAGESMFYRVTDASKIALVQLFDRLKKNQFQLFDTQVLSPLTEQMGAFEIPRNDYLDRLKKAIDLPMKW